MTLGMDCGDGWMRECAIATIFDAYINPAIGEMKRLMSASHVDPNAA
jgi:hypothetical protein